MVILLLLVTIAASGQSLRDLSSTTPLPPNNTLVIGILGGIEHWNDPNRGIRKLTLKLRQTPEVSAESIENRRVGTALRFIEKSLDTNGDRVLSTDERRQARIILYGQSLGGQAILRLARALNKRGIPVLLTVQVDSVGRTDHIIPSNVRAAVNFYQHELLTVWGETKISAADPQKTTILANKQFHYPPLLSDAPKPNTWVRWRFGGGHARMEADPIVWKEVESYIRQALKTK